MPATRIPPTPRKGGGPNFYKHISSPNLIGKFRIRKPPVVTTLQLNVRRASTTGSPTNSSSIEDTSFNDYRMDFSIVGGCKTPKKTGNFAHAFLAEQEKKEEVERGTEKGGQAGSGQAMVTNGTGPIITNGTGPMITNGTGPVITNATGPVITNDGTGSMIINGTGPMITNGTRSMITNASGPSKKRRNRQKNRKQSLAVIPDSEDQSESTSKAQSPSPLNNSCLKNKCPLEEDSSSSPKKIFGVSKLAPPDDEDEDFKSPSNQRQSFVASSTSTMSCSPKEKEDVKEEILTEWVLTDDEKENGFSSEDAGSSSATSNACIRICENMDRLNAVEYLGFIFQRANDAISQDPYMNILPLMCKVLQKREVHADIQEKILEIRQDVALMETASTDELFQIISRKVIAPALSEDFKDVKKTYMATSKIFLPPRKSH